MELLSKATKDPTSALFELVRVRSTLWCRSELGAPWGFSVAERRAAAFHFVVNGSCVLAIEGSEPLVLESGDLAIVPSGRAHVARSSAVATHRPLDEILDEHPPIDGTLTYGGDGARTEMLCGGFELDDPTGRVLGLLPPLVHVRGELDSGIGTTIEVIRTTLREARPGADAVVARLTDVILALAIQASLSGTPTAAAWNDPSIAEVVRVIEQRPDNDWSVTVLAARANLSRSVFVTRFREVTKESPMRFVSSVRLARAAALLHDRESTLDAVAIRSGFESAASLSRAFKRRYGMSPGAYRRERLSAIFDRPDAARSA